MLQVELFINGILKGLKYKLMLKVDIFEIKGSTHTIYWLTKSDKKNDLNNL